MKKEIAELWVKALRSGKYAQGVGCLRRVEHKDNQITNQFCCLGVLCDLYDSTRWDEVIGGETKSYVGYAAGREDRSFYRLPYGVSSWAGITNRKTSGPDGDGETQLMRLNDAGESFEEIARYIETNWEKM